MTAPETATGGEKLTQEKVAQVGDTVRRMVAAKAQERRGKPARTPADSALDVYGMLVKFQEGNTLKFEKADPSNSADHDILLPLRQDNKSRLVQITGVERANGVERFICEVVHSDGTTETTASVPREMVLDAQLVAQRKELAAGLGDTAEKQVFTSYIDALPQSGSKKLTDADLPAQTEAIKDRYSSVSYKPEGPDDAQEQSENDPFTQAHQAIVEKILALEGQEKLSKEDQQLLRDLRLASATQEGRWNAIFTTNVLDRMGRQDLADQLDTEGAVWKAEESLSALLKEAVNESQFQKWVKISEGERGVFELLGEKDFIDLLTKDKKYGAEIATGLFGRPDITAKDITKIMGEKLLQELPADVKEALEKGDSNGVTGVLKWVLMIMGGVVGGVALATLKIPELAGPSH